jgi:UDP-glucose 4-epimerase
LAWYESAHGINWLALRYFNVAGAEIGLAELETSIRIIPRSIRAAMGQGSPIRVFGNRYPTPDGTAVRDYVHVQDVSHANLLALKYLQKGGRSAVVNIGTGVGASVRQIIDTVAHLTGNQVPFVESESRTGDAASVIACPAKAQALLGWIPTRSDLKQIVLDAVTSYAGKTNLKTGTPVD